MLRPFSNTFQSEKELGCSLTGRYKPWLRFAFSGRLMSTCGCNKSNFSRFLFKRRWQTAVLNHEVYFWPANAFWTEDFSHSYTGRQYTLNMSRKLSVGKLNDLVRISFQPNLVYSLFFHDEKFFYISRNSVSGPPRVQKIVDPRMLPYYYQIGLTEVNELNVPNDPCNEDPDYNFNACVKERFARKVGCRTKWDHIQLKHLPICTNMTQFRYIPCSKSKKYFFQGSQKALFYLGDWTGS